ncbi:beta-N-acetylhexosaminidase [Amycolatopsis nigrescens]|uniref:beta-N-acetylhexosaminidase n=1 Tax=Amycolatopsis nigrescens TaxID=381445 RepID=UPI000378F971|nr:beta-N-acetylhexosaminidase [Amycolatopsis nigrescens]
MVGLLGAAVLGLSVLGPPALAEPAADASAAGHQGGSAQFANLLPAPVDAKSNPKADFWLSPATVIKTARGSAEAKKVGDYLAGLLRKSTGYSLPVQSGHTSRPAISLEIGKTAKVGDQGYQLDVARNGVTLRANTADGLFSGVQTLRQLLPAQIEATKPQPRKWTVPGGKIVDYPRFGYRAAMLDIARHFHTLDEIKTYIDEIAQHKINFLHLHLTDDQGWRIQIDSWPKLTTVGGGEGTGVDGVGGGFLTKADYAELNRYAASRHITVVPEIDMPGHTNAAQHTYAELNCDGVAPPARTDIEVGYSSLCINSEITYKFVEDVIRELAAMTPGPFLHVGGDEAHATSDADYKTFQDKVLPLVGKYGKRASGWNEVTKVNPPISVVPQYWDTARENASAAAAAARGNKFIMSPANKAYLDMKYDENTKLGLKWAGYVEVRDSYDWDPATYVTGIGEKSVFGVEAPLWSETLRSIDDIEFMAFPRLAGIAEIGWSPQSTHDWESYRARLAEYGPRWAAQGIDFYRSPQVDWK